MIITIIALWLAFNALLFIWIGYVRFRKWAPRHRNSLMTDDRRRAFSGAVKQTLIPARPSTE